MAELKLVGEILLILFFVIIVVLLANLIIPKGAETIGKITGSYIEYVESKTKGCKRGEIKNECLSCGKFGFEPNNTICEEKYGKNYFCDSDGYCKKFECPPPCDTRYQICYDKNRCGELKENACYYGKNCIIYLVPPPGETKYYAGYLYLSKNYESYAIIPCNFLQSKNEYECVIPKELLTVGQCYDGTIYWQGGSSSLISDIICAVWDSSAKNEQKIYIGTPDFDVKVEEFACWSKNHMGCPWAPGPAYWSDRSTMCKVKLNKKIKGTIYLHARLPDFKTASPFFASYFDPKSLPSNSIDIDGDYAEIRFTGFEKYKHQHIYLSLLVFDKGSGKFIISLPAQEVVIEFSCAKKGEICYSATASTPIGSAGECVNICCIDEKGAQYKCKDADPNNPFNTDSKCE
jgi:hypothetical protein